ncbi:hypothetical protein GCM10009431_30600 [Gaetbulibacter jejuensis]|uniref:Uncharacterized protein n=1 Tax=Gaetbulibacter jejuensis TaxID=584607 RepID=A0ABN1JZM3_9FLAO
MTIYNTVVSLLFLNTSRLIFYIIMKCITLTIKTLFVVNTCAVSIIYGQDIKQENKTDVK